MQYTLVPSSNRGGYFAVDVFQGALVLSRSLQDVPLGLNPFNLTVIAQDQPTQGQSLQDSVNVMVSGETGMLTAQYIVCTDVFSETILFQEISGSTMSPTISLPS